MTVAIGIGATAGAAAGYLGGATDNMIMRLTDVMMSFPADYVAASRAMGASQFHVLVKVILPATISPVIVLATLGLGVAILEVAGLAYLGIAGQPDDPEWGSMLASAKDHLSVSLWPIIVPGMAISLTVLGFNLLGDGLRDAVDPQSRNAD
jgi:peptide/nickel transport system permease protein